MRKKIFILLLGLFFTIPLSWFNRSLFINAISISRSERSTTFYVSLNGNDNNDGKSAATAFKTIQKAVNIAELNDIVYLTPGNYLQDFVSKRSGRSNAPITIAGSKASVIKGGGKAHIIEINHDNLILKGFSVDGLYGDGNSADSFREKLIYVQGKEKKAGVNGLKIVDMDIRNSGGECIRLRYFAQKNEIANNTIQNCGIHDFRFDAGGKNGEGIYIGTAPEQRKDGKNPTSDPDNSNGNWIHNNTINTQGNECVDIKESSSGNIVENNKCTGQQDPESGGMDSRGNGNTFRNNLINGNRGSGIRLGGDSFFDGINNNVLNNKILDNRNGGIKFQRLLQGKICNNEMSENKRGNAVGVFGKLFKPTVSCQN